MARIILDDISTRAPKDLDKQETKQKTASILTELDELQNTLFAEKKRSVLVVLQGMDASGKDGVVKNVFGTLNPLGVKAKAYKAPTDEELDHDFLWRIHSEVPAKGMIQIFNRSHYEDILVTRVHKWCNDELAYKRMKAINDFEELLSTHNDTHILKFYLHISRKEQEERLNERVQDPKKNWKYNAKDQEEAALWEEYRRMYEDCFEHCNVIPWTIVPADQNWYKEYTIASAVCNLLKELKLQYPKLSDQHS
jgi:PPK2 family polyphosphate:nucleotide phosphotransferase